MLNEGNWSDALLLWDTDKILHSVLNIKVISEWLGRCFLLGASFQNYFKQVLLLK